MDIKMKTVVQTRVSARCPTHARTDLSIRDVTLRIDEPEARGGTNTGPSPTETAISALVGCTNVISHRCAKALGVDIGHLKIDAVCDFDRRGVTLAEELAVPFQRIQLTVEADGPASQADLQRVAAEVAKYCPLAKLFRGAGTEIVEEWRKA
jgi:putative redox protein